MSDFKVSKPVYTQLQKLQESPEASPEHLQTLRQSMEVDGIDPVETDILAHIKDKKSFTAHHGQAKVTLNPNTLQFAPGQDITGSALGQTANGTQLSLGSLEGSPAGYTTEHEALQAIYDTGQPQNPAWAMMSWQDKPDLAVVQDAQGQYFLHQIESDSFFGNDISGYKEARQSHIQPHLPAGTQLVALATDNRHVRFYGAEVSPQTYPKVEGPLPGDSFADSDTKAQAALDRLAQMEQDLAQAGDHRGMFAMMFRTIAERAVQDSRQQAAQGQQTEAMLNSKIALDTAVKFFEAYDHYAAGEMDKVPESWRQAFDSGRLIEAKGTEQYNAAEILGLSLNAHLLHDLPLTLQEIGFDPNNPQENQAYNAFNEVIVSEKNKALGKVAQAYGMNDMTAVNTVFEGLAQVASPRYGKSAADTASWGGVGSIRMLASQMAQHQSPQDIKKTTTTFADLLRSFTPGGN